MPSKLKDIATRSTRVQAIKDFLDKNGGKGDKALYYSVEELAEAPSIKCCKATVGQLLKHAVLAGYSKNVLHKTWCSTPENIKRL
jgi:hypothetical protein